ncbi:Ribonuclease P protein subunit p25-like protein [Toxocara canis]|uniref:Ribonuclease P protein subunit p25-like protein n=1 Tax=Toxocara canis TaxID=6265 RepID=A0A0B2VRG1_TOXCA|nr:Ribonuclease P protein subunit p25-like protein [Toxocara canis]
MESYVKNEEVLIDCPPPFPSELIDGVNVMVVKEGTKFRNILGHVEKQFKDPNCRRVIFKGVGEATAKCISCVEVFKRSFTESVLYQWNEVIFSRKTDTWKPMKEGLSDLLVHVDSPTIFILISRDPFPEQYVNDRIRIVGELSSKELARRLRSAFLVLKFSSDPSPLESVLYQWNEVIFSRKTDTWKPMKEGLSDLLVHVDSPTIFILISRDPFPEQYVNDSCQSSDVEVIGFPTSTQRDRRERYGENFGKPKIKRPSEPNIWRRAPKKMGNPGASQPTKSKPAPVSAKNS